MIGLHIGLRTARTRSVENGATLSNLSFDPETNRFEFETDRNEGRLAWIVTTDAGPYTGEEIVNASVGGDVVAVGSVDAPFPTAPVDLDLPSLPPGDYWLHIAQRTFTTDNLTPLYSNVLTTEIDIERAVPVLSALAVTGLTDPVTASTTVGDGTIFMRTRPSADPAADAATIIAGGGPASGSHTVTAAGAQSMTLDRSSLAPGVYQLDAVHRRAGLFTPWLTSSVVSLAAPFEAGFDPASLAGARIVLDFSDLSTLWQNTDGTGAVTASGQSVGSVTNRGSLGGLFVNTGGTARPTYTEGSGLRWLAFNGSSTFLQLTLGANESVSGGYSVWVVAEEVGATTDACLFAHTSENASTYNNQHGGRMRMGTPTANAVMWRAGLDNSYGVSIADATAATLARAVIEVQANPQVSGSPTNVWLRTRYAADSALVDRASFAVTWSSAQSYPNLATSLRRFTVGCDLAGSGTPTTRSNFAACRIHAVLLVAGSLTTTERDNCRAWCAARAGFS